ncbi:MAG TPA: ABC transporter substrate-binding protein, partial [Actinomycetota bacterium]|nr:ABC transporter substrate-binding protein [Actinomycetota bacterium]
MRKLHVLSAVVALALLLVACSGYPAARLQSKGDDTIEIIEPLPSQSPVEALEGGTTPSPGTTGSPRPKQSPRVIARTKSGTTITVGPGGLPRADIWPAADDRRGFTDNEIKLCMHAAFALGPVFNTSPDDGNVYWKKVNAEGGVFGRQVKVTYLDDLYTSAGTTQALDKCESEQDPFLYIGGVGFDQAPAGRSWAESHHQPYLFNMAVETTGLKYSFSVLPSIETNGRILGQFVGSRFPGKKVAVIYVDTDNWRAGYQTFE